jgi:hypothetical protein
VYLRDATVVPPLSLLLFGKDMDILYSEGFVLVDKWIRLKADAKTAVLIKELRVRLQAMLRGKITEMTVDKQNAQSEVIGESHRQTVDVLNQLFVSRKMEKKADVERKKNVGFAVRSRQGGSDRGSNEKNGERNR